jgi:hypothetical protein
MPDVLPSPTGAGSITFVVTEDEVGGLVAVARGHDGRSLVTQGNDLEDLKQMTRDCVDAAYEANEVGRPGFIHLHIVRDVVLAA